MQENQVSISSITGVDVQLEIAGPGSRSFAFVIDWHIRLILAFAWFVASLLLVAGSLSFAGVDDSPELFAWVVVVPALAIYLLYHPFVELLMSGRSPGKRMAGVRVVTREGDVPGAGAILIRNVFRIVDSLPAFYIVGLGASFLTAQHVRIGDLAAGTLLVVDHDAGGKSLAKVSSRRTSNLDPKLADLVDEVLERWPNLHPEKRREIAQALLMRVDPARSPDALSLLSEAELRRTLQQSLVAKEAV